MTITNIALNENEERTLRQISRGRYGNLEASESELDCIAVVTEFCYKHIAEQETPNVLNDILAIVKKRVHIIDDNNVDQFMTTVYQDIKRSNKLAKSVMSTVLHIEDVVRDSSVLDNSFGVDVRRVVVVSLVTAAIRHYLAAVEDGEVSEDGQEPNEETQSETVVTETSKDDTVEVIDVDVSDVIGVAADTSDKYKDVEHVDNTDNTSAKPKNQVGGNKKLAQMIVTTGAADKYIDVIATRTGLGKQVAAEFIVEAVSTLFDCCGLLTEEKYGDVEFSLSKILVQYATSPSDIVTLTESMFGMMQKNVIGECIPDADIVINTLTGLEKYYAYKLKTINQQNTVLKETCKAIENKRDATKKKLNNNTSKTGKQCDTDRTAKSIEQRQRESARAIVNALFPGLHCATK